MIERRAQRAWSGVFIDCYLMKLPKILFVLTLFIMSAQCYARPKDIVLERTRDAGFFVKLLTAGRSTATLGRFEPLRQFFSQQKFL